MRGRRRAVGFSIKRKLFLVKAPKAIIIQKAVRGHITRLHNWHVAKAIVAMYNQRWQEAQMRMCVRLQAFGRRFLTHYKVRILLELRSRMRLDENYACAVCY